MCLWSPMVYDYNSFHSSSHLEWVWIILKENKHNKQYCITDSKLICELRKIGFYNKTVNVILFRSFNTFIWENLRKPKFTALCFFDRQVLLLIIQSVILRSKA
jgi:hypothetical protein